MSDNDYHINGSLRVGGSLYANIDPSNEKNIIIVDENGTQQNLKDFVLNNSAAKFEIKKISTGQTLAEVVAAIELLLKTHGTPSQKRTIYFIEKDAKLESNIYDEFAWNEDSLKLEIIGSSGINFSNIVDSVTFKSNVTFHVTPTIKRGVNFEEVATSTQVDSKLTTHALNNTHISSNERATWNAAALGETALESKFTNHQNDVEKDTSSAPLDYRPHLSKSERQQLDTIGLSPNPFDVVVGTTENKIYFQYFVINTKYYKVPAVLLSIRITRRDGYPERTPYYFGVFETDANEEIAAGLNSVPSNWKFLGFSHNRDHADAKTGSSYGEWLFNIYLNNNIDNSKKLVFLPYSEVEHDAGYTAWGRTVEGGCSVTLVGDDDTQSRIYRYNSTNNWKPAMTITYYVKNDILEHIANRGIHLTKPGEFSLDDEYSGYVKLGNKQVLIGTLGLHTALFIGLSLIDGNAFITGKNGIQSLLLTSRDDELSLLEFSNAELHVNNLNAYDYLSSSSFYGPVSLYSFLRLHSDYGDEYITLKNLNNQLTLNDVPLNQNFHVSDLSGPDGGLYVTNRTAVLYLSEKTHKHVFLLSNCDDLSVDINYYNPDDYNKDVMETKVFFNSCNGMRMNFEGTMLHDMTAMWIGPTQETVSDDNAHVLTFYYSKGYAATPLYIKLD